MFCAVPLTEPPAAVGGADRRGAAATRRLREHQDSATLWATAPILRAARHLAPRRRYYFWSEFGECLSTSLIEWQLPFSTSDVHLMLNFDR